MRHTAALLVAVILLFQTTSSAQKPNLRLVNDFVKAKHKYHDFNGSVLVAERGRIIYKKSVGYSDLKNRRPLHEGSVFEAASITKQFTAAAIMLCKERGWLSLDDPLAKYFPELPYEGITLRHMLTHTSGLPEANELMYKVWDSDKPATNRDLIEQLVRHRPAVAFKAGEDFKYSNTNYALLASIVEKVSGQTFRDFMARHLFEPLGMKETRILNWEAGDYSTIPNHTLSYIFDAEQRQFRLPSEMAQWKKALPLNGIVGSRGVNTTAGDLFKWQESLKTSKILSLQSILEMESPQVKGSVDGSDAYGYGLAVKALYDDTRIYHYGGWNGYWNSLQHFKRTDRTVIVLSNNDSEKGLTNAIAAILFGQPVALPSKHTETRLSPPLLNRFVGVYEAANGSSFSLENRGGKLYRVIPNAEPKELKPESKTKLFYPDDSDRQLEFDFERQTLKRVFFISNGLKTELKKVK
jgi:CubicO group peptidase (beta-lactamase class C family)